MTTSNVTSAKNSFIPPVGEVELEEFEMRMRSDSAPNALPSRNVVIVTHVVEPDDRVATFKQALRDVEADEPRGAGDE